MQGFPCHLLGPSSLTQRRGMELAGNAFCGFVVGPIIFAAISSTDALSMQAPLPQLLPTLSVDIASMQAPQLDSSESDYDTESESRE